MDTNIKFKVTCVNSVISSEYLELATEAFRDIIVFLFNKCNSKHFNTYYLSNMILKRIRLFHYSEKGVRLEIGTAQNN